MKNPLHILSIQKLPRASVMLFFIGALWVSHGHSSNTSDKASTMMSPSPSFGRENLQISNSVSWMDPTRFSMSQSYSTHFSSSSHGSSSAGLYLNTLTYQFSAPLILSMDLGFHMPFHGSGNGGHWGHLSESGNAGSFVLPRIGLDYRPTENLLISLQYVQLQDAYKAYGPFHGFYRNSYFNRSPFKRVNEN